MRQAASGAADLSAPGDLSSSAASFVRYLRAANVGSAEVTDIPPWLIFALDHAIFIGVMTNSIFGFARLATAARQDRWAWANQVISWA